MKLLKNEKGTSMVTYALMLSLLMGICAIVVDIGKVAVEKGRFQNALDASALAAAYELPDPERASEKAVEYIQKNGYSQEDVSITFSEDYSEIYVQGNMELQYFFARFLNFQTTTIRPSAGAAGGGIGHAFDFALFSGSTSQALIINGGKANVTGSTHTNHNFILHGGQSTISGACQAVGSITVTGNNVNIGTKKENASYVDMPDFSETIKEQAQSCGTYYNSNKVYNGNIHVSSSIYVNGEININSSKFSGTGCVLAKNSIVFNGSCLYSSPGDAICFYSQNGNIIFNGANAVIHGIIYAPNGTVIFNGANSTVYGRVIAKNIIFNGSGITVESQNSDLKSLPSKGARLIR